MWRRLRGSNSHALSDITVFKTDKHANLASLRCSGGGQRDRTSTPFRASRFSKPVSTPALRASEYGADSRNRAGSLLGGSQALCQLSYVRAVRPEGIELPSAGQGHAAHSPCQGRMMWSGRQDLNLQPPASKAGTLPD